jgi:hypothetical protein
MVSIEALNRYSARDFEEWFEARFKEHYGEDAERRFRAFDFGHLGIFGTESHLDAIEQLDEQLSPKARRHLRDALEALFRHAQPSSFPWDGMQDLIHLIGRLRAYSAVKAFEPVLVSGPWGELEPSLVYDALSVLFEFERSTEAYDAMKALVSQDNFSDRYVFDAYALLFRTAPAKWADDLSSLRRRFARVMTAVKKSADPEASAELLERERELAADLADAVSLSRLASGLSTLRVYEGESLAWFVRRLFEEDGPLAVAGGKEHRWRLEKRGDGAHSEPFRPSIAVRSILLDEGYVSPPPVFNMPMQAVIFPSPTARRFMGLGHPPTDLRRHHGRRP